MIIAFFKKWSVYVCQNSGWNRETQLCILQKTDLKIKIASPFDTRSPSQCSFISQREIDTVNAISYLNGGGGGKV